MQTLPAQVMAHPGQHTPGNLPLASQTDSEGVFLIPCTTFSVRKENFSYLRAPAAKDFLTGEKPVLIVYKMEDLFKSSIWISTNKQERSHLSCVYGVFSSVCLVLTNNIPIKSMQKKQKKCKICYWNKLRYQIFSRELDKCSIYRLGWKELTEDFTPCPEKKWTWRAHARANNSLSGPAARKRADYLAEKSGKAETVQRVPISHWDLCCYEEDSLSSRPEDL